MDFSLPVVLGAGILSFLSPCVLPLVPPYLTYMSGAGFETMRAESDSGSGPLQRRTAFVSLFFVLGFSVVFIALGATATAFGQLFRQALPILTPLAGLAIVAMGLHFFGVFRIALLDRQIRHNGPSSASGPAGAFLMGLAFAIGWTPCIGPVLAAVLSVASSRGTAWEGAGLLALYSLGLGIPFFVAGLAMGPFMRFFKGFKKHLHGVERAVGVLLVVTGISFVSGDFMRASFWLLDTFPVLASFG